MIYSTRYVHSKSIKMLNLYYHELMGKDKEHERKKHLMMDDHVLDKVLSKIKERIGIEKFGDTKILIDTDNKLLEDITFKNVLILMTCAVKDDDKFYPQLFLEKTYCMVNKHNAKHLKRI